MICFLRLTDVEGRRGLNVVSTPGADLELVCDELVAQANAQGGRDQHPRGPRPTRTLSASVHEPPTAERLDA